MVRKGAVIDGAISNLSREVGEYPCVLYTRTQEEKKTRNVWGYPISDTIREQQFFVPWLEYEKRMPQRAALMGPDIVDLAVTKILESMTSDDIVVSIDFSAFDASISTEQSFKAFSLISSLFQSRFIDELNWLYRRFITIPVYTPDGEISGPHGVPSGSSFTNSVDSLVQLLASRDFSNRCQVQGDDGIYVISRSDHSDLMDAMTAAGLQVNEDKSGVYEDQEGVFLQRYYSSSYPNRYGKGLGGVYSLYRAMMRLKYLERWTDFKRLGIEGSDFFSLRAIMILENCKHHPAFVEFVKYVHSLDAVQLHFSKQGLKAFSSAQKSRVRAGVVSSAFSTEGIDRFETMKILKTL
jgi:hypothetical protein